MIVGNKDSLIFCHSNPVSGKKLHRIAINARDISSVQEPESGDECWHPDSKKRCSLTVP